MRTFTSSTRTALTCAALAVALGGCGSSGDTATSSSTSSSTTNSAGTSSTTTTSSSPVSTSTTSSTSAAPTTSGSCPSSAQLLAAWKAYPKATPGVTGFSQITCWSRWVISFPQGPGDGAISFSTKPSLHVTTPAEAQQFGKEVCAAKHSPAAWKNDESILVC